MRPERLVPVPERVAGFAISGAGLFGAFGVFEETGNFPLIGSFKGKIGNSLNATACGKAYRLPIRPQAGLFYRSGHCSPGRTYRNQQGQSDLRYRFYHMLPLAMRRGICASQGHFLALTMAKTPRNINDPASPRLITMLNA